jgi:hypothetical protein
MSALIVSCLFLLVLIALAWLLPEHPEQSRRAKRELMEADTVRLQNWADILHTINSELSPTSTLRTEVRSDRAGRHRAEPARELRRGVAALTYTGAHRVGREDAIWAVSLTGLHVGTGSAKHALTDG